MRLCAMPCAETEKHDSSRADADLHDGRSARDHLHAFEPTGPLTQHWPYRLAVVPVTIRPRDLEMRDVAAMDVRKRRVPHVSHITAGDGLADHVTAGEEGR